MKVTNNKFMEYICMRPKNGFTFWAVYTPSDRIYTTIFSDILELETNIVFKNYQL